jgi:hypothetical protein
VAPIVDANAAARLKKAVQAHIAYIVSASDVWWQDSSLYHSTVWHASPHQVPLPLPTSASLPYTSMEICTAVLKSVSSSQPTPEILKVCQLSC